MSSTASRFDAGIVCGLGAYLTWGLFPAFFGLLEPAGPVEILAHRVLWTLLAMLLLLAVLGRLGSLRGLGVRVWALVAAASVAIAVNWGTYIYGVVSGRVVETALGYFINPLVSVLFGVLFFRERLRRAQVAALFVATAAVAVITVDYGRPPLIALTLAFSFALYGVVKKIVPLDPRTSLTGRASSPCRSRRATWSSSLSPAPAPSPATGPGTRCCSCRPGSSRRCRCCCSGRPPSGCRW